MSDVTRLSVRRIPVRYSRTLLFRGVAIWMLARLAVVALYTFIAASARRSPDVASAFTAGSPIILTAWTIALSTVLVRLDLHRRQEIAMLHNLGVLTSHAILLGLLPAIVMEAAMAVLR